MTKADEMNLENLMDNIRKVEEAVKSSNNKDEIEKICQFAISALEDYADTKKKICALINKNRNLFYIKPYIKGSYSGYMNGNPVTITNDTYNLNSVFEFDHGSFGIKSDNHYISQLDIIVGGISGVKRRTGYCGAWQDHDMDTTNWVAEDIEVVDTTSFYANHPEWTKDLVAGHFLVGDRKMPWTIENLKKYSFTIETWVNIKNMASNTRKRTEELVKRFRMCLEYRIKNATEKINNLENATNDEYKKVGFLKSHLTFEKIMI